MYEIEVIDLLTLMGVEKIKPNGSQLQASCPFSMWTHGKGKDVHPSFSILLGAQNKWQCFACGHKGTSIKTLIDTYERYSGSSLGIRDSTNQIRNNIMMAGSVYSIKQEFRAGAWFDYSAFRIFDLNDYERYLKKIPQYAVDRGITPFQARKWRIGFNTDSQRLFIPIFNKKHEMVGYSERAIHEAQSPKYLHAHGFKRNNYLYGMQFIDKTNPIACVSEGFMDVLNLDRNGVRNAYAIMGTAVSPEQLDFLLQFKEVWIFPHNDPIDEFGNSPGMTSALFLKTLLMREGVAVKLAPFINDKKDVGDWTSEELKVILHELTQQSAENPDPFA